MASIVKSQEEAVDGIIECKIVLSQSMLNAIISGLS